MNRDSRQVLTEWLVLSAQAGDEAAFRDLHNLWRNELRRFISSRVEDPVATDEVLTDVWLGIAKNLPRLDDPACFPRWAFRIVERRSADWMRRRARARERERAMAGAADTLAPAGSPPPEPPESILALRAAIARLPDSQRELIRLHYELGLSLVEIAEILSIAAGTVKSRLFSAREILKQQLNRKSS